jgi:hypothetical protein
VSIAGVAPQSLAPLLGLAPRDANRRSLVPLPVIDGVERLIQKHCHTPGRSRRASLHADAVLDQLFDVPDDCRVIDVAGVTDGLLKQPFVVPVIVMLIGPAFQSLEASGETGAKHADFFAVREHRRVHQQIVEEVRLISAQRLVPGILANSSDNLERERQELCPVQAFYVHTEGLDDVVGSIPVLVDRLFVSRQRAHHLLDVALFVVREFELAQLCKQRPRGAILLAGGGGFELVDEQGDGLAEFVVFFPALFAGANQEGAVVAAMQGVILADEGGEPDGFSFGHQLALQVLDHAITVGGSLVVVRTVMGFDLCLTVGRVDRETDTPFELPVVCDGVLEVASEGPFDHDARLRFETLQLFRRRVEGERRHGDPWADLVLAATAGVLSDLLIDLESGGCHVAEKLTEHFFIVRRELRGNKGVGSARCVGDNHEGLSEAVFLEDHLDGDLCVRGQLFPACPPVQRFRIRLLLGGDVDMRAVKHGISSLVVGALLV